MKDFCSRTNLFITSIAVARKVILSLHGLVLIYQLAYVQGDTARQNIIFIVEY